MLYKETLNFGEINIEKGKFHFSKRTNQDEQF